MTDFSMIKKSSSHALQEMVCYKKKFSSPDNNINKEEEKTWYLKNW